MAESLKCCNLLKCLDNPKRVLQEGEARVNVRAFESKPRKTFVVGWDKGGTATFHQSCWQALVQATCLTTGDIILSDQERSMILDAKKTAEYHDSDETIDREAERIASILKQSQYAISFTGAGISTAAGIGDFRGIHGKWTERDKVKNFGAQAKPSSTTRTPVEQLRPTYTHEALVKLQEMGLIKFIISQNTDGLHCLSGIPMDRIAELHGNGFVEKCEECETRYQRNFTCRRCTNPAIEKKCPRCRINHRTGRRCSKEGCSGYLMNTIINFGDYLEGDILEKARQEAERADAVLTLGSTLRVSPANDLVTMGQQPFRLMICNRQTTPVDIACLIPGPNGEPFGSRVFGDCDDLMKGIMKNVMSAEDLSAWENERRERMVKYNEMRGKLASKQAEAGKKS